MNCPAKNALPPTRAPSAFNALPIWIEEGAMATVEGGSYTCVLESDFAFRRETISQGHATVRGEPVRRYCRAGEVLKRTAITFQVAPNLGPGEPTSP